MASFDENGKYIKTNWKAGDKITATKLNKIEESIEAVNDNDISRHVETDARLDALEAKDVAHDKELTNIKNTIADNKAAAELGDYEINSRMTFLEEDVEQAVAEVNNVASTVDGKIATAEANMEAMVAEVEADLEGLHAKDEELSAQLAYNGNKLKELKKYNVQDYDILPDGNDVIPKLNSLILEVSQTGGGEIVFQEGTYIIKPFNPNPDGSTRNVIYMRDNVFIKGVSKEKTIFKIPDNHDDLNEIIYIITDYDFYNTPTYNIGISNICFDMNIEFNQKIPSETNNKSIIRFHRVDGFVMSNCKIMSNGIHSLQFRTGTTDTELESDRSNGNYTLNNFKISDNVFIFKTILSEYYDNTQIVFMGRDCIIENNKFIVEDNYLGINNGGANAGLEVSGINIDVRNNYFEGFIGCMDITSIDSYGKYRNINVEKNTFIGARGLVVWCYDTTHQNRGIKINKNYFYQTVDIEQGRVEKSSRCCFGFANHTTDSLGLIKDVYVTDNYMTMTGDSLDYIKNLDTTTNPYSDREFDSYYCVIYLGGTNTLNDICIKNNQVINTATTFLYNGSKNMIENVEIIGNKLKNVGNYGARPLFVFTSKNRNFVIKNNIIEDSSDDTLSEKIMFKFKEGVYNNSYTRFFNFYLINNLQVHKNIDTHPKQRYKSDYGTWLPTMVVDFHEATTAPTFSQPFSNNMVWVNTTTNEVWISISSTWVKISTN